MTQSGLLKWPYVTKYDVHSDVDADVLVLGGGMAGPLAAITAAKKGLKVVLVDKGCTSYSGAGGSGFDHWTNSPGPESPVSPLDLVNARHETSGGYKSRIADYISITESYDVLMEMESYGAKVRDTDDEFAGSDFRDEKTKLLYASDYVNKYTMRMWGRTFKAALYKEMTRCGLKLYERVMATALLNENGAQGARVVGATGVNVRTGQFYVFRAKATVLCLGHPGSQGWVYSAEHQGMGGRHGPGLASGDGQAMAWKAGAELAMMENSVPVRRHHAPTEGSYFASWHPCTLVDTEGREIPWVDRDGTIISRVSDRAKPAPGQKLVLPTGPHAMKSTSTGKNLYYKYMRPSLTPDLNERLAKGEFRKPLYCDFPGMPPDERRVIYGLMIGHEGTTWLAYHNMTRAGFDPDKHLLQLYDEPVEGGGYGWRRMDRGGVVIDWDMKTSLDGLYAAGEQVFAGGGVSHALSTGRYAARRASEYVAKAAPVISQSQVEAEKARVYAPLKREGGMEWRELASGVAKVMQHYCGDIKSDERLKIGLRWMDELNRGEAKSAHARNPHELMRTLEVFSIMDWCGAVMHQCLARKASSVFLNFKRSDYAKTDPPQWHKWITVKQYDGDVAVGSMPIDFGGDLETNYSKHRGI